ncbi:MAG TPA: DNA methyltransferase [Clostridia bacterium]|nr:DNA methyltransferase [Clostridia bacterium]
MASQTFKSVYFADFPAPDGARNTFKIAFGTKECELYEQVRGLSSHELRGIFGHQDYLSLQEAAQSDGLPLNSFCVRILKTWAEKRTGEAQPALFGMEDVGVYSTFKSSKTAPLHRWYPYIEGYAPEFVQHVMERHSPDSTSILDPFGGVGTTPITAAKAGKRAYYCELNPLLQFLIQAKTAALSLASKQRAAVADRLRELCSQWRNLVVGSASDKQLDACYQAVFDKSAFFSERTYQHVLQARTALDEISCREPLIARFVSIAILASLVPSSLLCRAGDLRFRKGKELTDIEDFIDFTQRNLQTVADDVETAEQLATQPILVTGDAKRLSNLPALGVDAVITSPPYLNGTNYFRNTKIELWFLRALRSQADLSAFRDSAITAGINDVRGKKDACTAPAVAELVRRLEANAYDGRIPRMVANYFYDMDLLLKSLRSHVRENGTIAIDIGDSVYAKVHVPTDELLCSLAEALGMELRESVHLRTRVSRDTSPLKQVLLVFRNTPGRAAVAVTRHNDWDKRWLGFKKALPHQKPPLSKRNWGHPLHSLCSYQGKMKPALASKLVETFVPENGRLLDPFGGVGTIPFEAALQGRFSYSFDISPAALAISRAKLGKPTREAVSTVLAELETYIEANEPTKEDIGRAEQIRFNSVLSEYFHQRTFREIVLARKFFAQRQNQDASSSLVLASLLHVLHGNRPYALSRRSHPITPFAPSGPRKYKGVVAHVRAKVCRSLDEQLPSNFVEGEVLECDATACWPQHVNDLDAVITSPPFFDSTRFYLANWMRLWFMGWERDDFNVRPLSFVDELQKQSFSVYEPIFRQARERIRKNGVVVLHLGLSRKCDMMKEIEKVAAPWFRVADRFSENVEHCESHGVRDKGTVNKHQYLVLS